MSNLMTLIKYSLINRLHLNKLFKKNNKATGIAFVGVALLIGLGILVLATLYMSLLGMAYAESGVVDIILLMGISLSGIMCLFMNIPMCETTLFHAKDYELLQAMPIKTKDIVTSKLISLILVNYLITGLLIISSSIAYFIYAGFDVQKFLLLLVVFIFSPYISLTVASVLSYFVSMFTSKLKHKNLISTILSIVFIVILMMFSFNMGEPEDGNPEELRAMMVGVLSKLSYPSYLAYQGIMGDYLKLGIYCTISLVVIILFIIAVSKNFAKLNSRSNSGYTDKNFKIDSINKTQSTSQLKTLFFTEIKRFFSIPGYAINVLVGPIMGTVMIIILLSQEEMAEAIPELQQYITLIIIAMVSLFSSMLPTTTCAISLEGKSLWIVKSLPIKTKSILLVKILVSVLMCLPFTIINGILCVIFFQANLLDLLFVLVVPTLYTFIMAEIGLMMNLVFPRFDWDNPLKAVKQSASGIITMLISFALTVILVIGIVILIQLMDVYLILLIISLLLIVGLIITTHLVYNKGVELFDKIN